MAESASNRDSKSALQVAESAKKKSATHARATRPDAMSDAAEKSPKSGTVRDTKENPNCEKRCVLEVPPC